MKALILAGGKGSRLRPITFSTAKQLVPVANKPVIEYGIEAICEAGISDFGIIVGDSHGEIESALGDGSRWGAKFTYIPQDAPLGLAHAVKTAKPYLQDDRFIMYLGDNLIKTGVAGLVDEFKNDAFDASILLTQVPNPEEFGVAVLDGDRVVHLEEKPKQPKSDFALVGVYLFGPSVFDAIDTLQPSFRGEYEITDAIQKLIDDGKNVRSHIVTGWWKDTGTVQAMLEANRLILETMSHSIDGEIYDSEIDETVSVGEGARIVSSCIRGPAIIGPRCVIEHAYVGPFTSISKGVTLKNAEIEYSIVMDDCRIEDAGRITGSLIGRGVNVTRAARKPASLGLVLGDNSSVTLP
jgi:glucose-1-phosphate thymidylyltransferase